MKPMNTHIIVIVGMKPMQTQIIVVANRKAHFFVLLETHRPQKTTDLYVFAVINPPHTCTLTARENYCKVKKDLASLWKKKRGVARFLSFIVK